MFLFEIFNWKLSRILWNVKISLNQRVLRYNTLAACFFLCLFYHRWKSRHYTYIRIWNIPFFRIGRLTAVLSWNHYRFSGIPGQRLLLESHILVGSQKKKMSFDIFFRTLNSVYYFSYAKFRLFRKPWCECKHCKVKQSYGWYILQYSLTASIKSFTSSPLCSRKNS